jgi:hypothetical protein
MNQNDDQEKRMEQFLDRMLKEPDMPAMPDTFTDKLMVKVEKRQNARIVFNEFLIKTAIAAGLLMLISLLIFLPEFSDQKQMAIDQLKNPQALIYAAVVVLFTYTADQLVLRYLMKMRKRG